MCRAKHTGLTVVMAKHGQHAMIQTLVEITDTGNSVQTVRRAKPALAPHMKAGVTVGTSAATNAAMLDTTVGTQVPATGAQAAAVISRAIRLRLVTEAAAPMAKCANRAKAVIAAAMVRAGQSAIAAAAHGD